MKSRKSNQVMPPVFIHGNLEITLLETLIIHEQMTQLGNANLARYMYLDNE